MRWVIYEVEPGLDKGRGRTRAIEVCERYGRDEPLLYVVGIVSAREQNSLVRELRKGD